MAGINLFTTRTMMGVYEEYDAPGSHFLDRYFPRVQTFTTELVDFDLIQKGGPKLAPFVMPTAAGRPMRSKGVVTKTFKPAYVKPLTEVDPTRPFTRRAGERYGGDLSPAERRQAAITEILLDHRNQVLRRKEFMAGELLRTGMVTIEGEDYPRVVVDFGRDPTLTAALTGGNRWGQTGVDPIKTLEDKAALTQAKSGLPATEVTFSPKAWTLFRANERVERLLDNRRQVSGEIEMGPIARGGPDKPKHRYVGNIGDFDFWTYDDLAEADDGSSFNLMGEFDVIQAAPQVNGVQAHGAIRDPRAGYQALELFPKNWIDENPSAEWVMTASSPLVVLPLPNGTCCTAVS
ncbi:major capsid protein [Azospirillum doebereinerae]|uniref:major capsid protein n=1 Tax=Azospirillum doebereinerae TaxID=92933 RepID=UPI001EE4FF3C|nr:major capsid protein [Azospirillum doebereinerae]MCG5240089.1 major capsid protein [Azospirillum doebereinerae]